MLLSFVDRLVPLWKERETVTDDLKDARREKRQTSVDRLLAERTAIDADLAKVFADAKAAGFDPQAVEIVARETMETDDERRKRQDFEILLQVYREAIAKERQR